MNKMDKINKMNNLIDYWFTNKNVWFNPSQLDDEYIYTTFFKEEFFSLYTSKNEYQLLDNFKKGMNIILLYDQVPRHANRILKNVNVSEYTSKIISFAEKFYVKHRYSLDADYFAFVLLPLRHTKDYTKILYVIKETIIQIKKYPKELKYKRFLKATLERYILQCDDSINIEKIIPIDTIQEIIDPANICELGLEIYKPRSIEKDLPKIIKINEEIIKVNDETIKKIISLSGGVDSMIMSYILTKKYGPSNVVAVHINYNNRKECESEVEVIKSWCSFLNIRLFIRKIIELNRPECMELELRDLYETITRDLRYLTYQNVAKLINVNKCIVYLGHNKDDRFENILTNIVSESLYCNLNGMAFETIQQFKNDSITFIRPMLNIIKSDIYKFANYCQIPHFIDSTPKWSQRGKIRDSVRPAIESWNSKAIESFFGLSDVVSELMIILDSTADQYVINIKNDKILRINITNKLLEKILFKSIFTKLSYFVSQKGLESFYKKIEYIKSNFEKYKINAQNFYQLNKQTKLQWKKINNE